MALVLRAACSVSLRSTQHVTRNQRLICAYVYWLCKRLRITQIALWTREGVAPLAILLPGLTHLAQQPSWKLRASRKVTSQNLRKPKLLVRHMLLVLLCEGELFIFEFVALCAHDVG